IENYTHGTHGNSTPLFKNSKIHTSGSYVYNCTAINCNLYEVEQYPSVAISCIITTTNGGNSANGTKIINSLLDRNITDSRATIENCYIFDGTGLLDENMDCTLNLENYGYLGQDGTTVVGIHGGESPFSENPSVPTVDTANSSVKYDSSTNKLNVNITVKAD
ncbi:MAG: hypothetical protein K2L00_04805, partial [Muribaculaceae bacterium]|nr:hypothetical protein [Muribaculaceae bacterium]